MTNHTRQHDIEALEPRTLLAGDMALVSVVPTLSYNDNLRTRVIEASVTVQNVGDEMVSRGVQISLFLSRNDTFDISDYRIFDRVLNNRFNPGVAITYNFKVPMPTDFAGLLQPGNAAPDDYKIIARVTARNPAEDTNAANNTLTSQTFVPVRYDFGDIGEGRKWRQFTAFLDFGNAVTFKINGPGRGEITLENGRTVVRLTGTTDKTTLRMDVPTFFSGAIGELVVDGDLRAIYAPRVSVNGDITINGTVQRIQLLDVRNSSFIIGATGAPMDLILRSATNVSLDSLSPIRNLTAGSWVTTDQASDVILAPSINTLRIAGASNVELSLSGGLPGRPTLGSAQIGGSLTGRWNINGDVRLIRAQSISNFRVNIAGELNSLISRGNFSGTLAAQTLNSFFTRGSVNNTTVLVGANLGADVALGGTGPAADSFAPGEIRRISIGGGMENTIFAVSLDPVDGGIFNGNDRFLDSSSRIRSISVKGQVGSSSFAAPVLPVRAVINGKSIVTAGDIRFTDTL